MNICVVSNPSPYTVGGLAGYMRLLAANIDRTDTVTNVCRFHHKLPDRVVYGCGEPSGTLEVQGRNLSIVCPNPLYLPLLTNMLRLITRPALRGIAKGIISAAYFQNLDAAIPRDTDVVHYVGTGWEMIGFPVADIARRRHAAFTIWPAVHPNTWGDSTLDIDLYNRADMLFAQSNYERCHLAARGVEDSQLTVCGLGPATIGSGNGKRFRAAYGLEDRPLILFIGRKNEGKGFPALNDAMPLILRSFGNACLVAIGPRAGTYQSTLSPACLLDLGAADDQTKEDALDACDVFCLPSSGEAFGIVYVEAWSYGKPVVGGPAPAVRELITENVNGLCVDQSPAEISEAIGRLLGDQALCRRLGQAGRRLQQERYNWELVVRKHYDVWQAAIKRKETL